MSDEKQATRHPFKQAVKAFYEDKTLSDVQMDALQKRLAEHEAVDEPIHQKPVSRYSKQSVYKWTGSMAASFLLFVVMMSYLQTPDLINFAYADIQKDVHLNNGMQSSMQQWLDENNIASVPALYPVEMSKFCRLDRALTTHLRIAGKEQGLLNVFFHQGARPLHWFGGAGTVDDMNWKLVKVRSDLTLVVLYSQDMREKSVLHILHEMLPELSPELKV